MNRRKGYFLLIILAIIAVTFFRTFYSGPKENSRKNGDYSVNEKFDRSLRPLIFTKHAKCRMACRDITEQEIESILHDGKLNQAKSEPNGKPDPKYAVEGFSKDGQHLRVIFAASSRGMVVVTCIDLEKEWKCDCR